MESSAEPRLLILETSGRVGQVALARGDALLAVRRLEETRRHARDLAPAGAAMRTVCHREPVSWPRLAGTLTRAASCGWDWRAIELGSRTICGPSSPSTSDRAPPRRSGPNVHRSHGAFCAVRCHQ